jgi:D-alanine-D-alanine ligase
MKIGFTFDLRDDYLAAGYSELATAEFDRADTIDAIADAVADNGHAVDRIGSARALVERLAAGDRWDIVFNICEGLHGPGREAQVPAILDLFEIPYTFADPCVMAVCLDKRLAKLVVRDAGLATPRWQVVEQVDDCEKIDLALPLFAKPNAEGTGKGVTPRSYISQPSELRDACDWLLNEYQQPVLVEEYLPGREFTVGLVGTGSQARVLGTMEIVLRSSAEAFGYSYHNKEHCEELVDYLSVDNSDAVAEKCAHLALAAWQALGGRDGGRIDIRCDAAGEPQFIEANPLAGLHPEHSDLPMIATRAGVSYESLIGAILQSAASRLCQQVGAPL